MTSRYTIEAYRGDEPFAFVSYAHEDTDRVFEELRHLHDAGLRFYYDEGIHPGHAWHDDLAAAIERCAVFVIFLTKRSVQSRNCLRELNFALDRHRDVLAVHLDPVVLPKGLQLALGDRQAIIRHRFDEATYRARLNAALGEYVGTTTAASPISPITQSPPLPQPVPRRASFFAAAIVALAVLAAGAWLWRSYVVDAEHDAAQYVAFLKAARSDDAMAAFRAGGELSDARRASEEFQSLWSTVTSEVELAIATPEATVSFRPYAAADESDWIPLGRTPFAGAVTLPNDVIELRIEKPGHVTGNYAIRVPGPLARPVAAEHVSTPIPVSTPIELTPLGEIDESMVRVPSSNMPVFVPGWTPDVAGNFANDIPAFAVAKYEVTNREFQDFVDAGGYQEASYWRGFAVELDGFVDSTGQPGPAQWSLGRFADGDGDLPVTGISWYEAAAYARYRNAVLPTLHHWARYALAPWEGFALVGPAMAAAGNFNQTHALAARGARALGPWGTFDTAGNVSEWLWNAVEKERLTMGGSWSDYSSELATLASVDPMTRSPIIGLRIMRTLAGSGIAPELLDPIERIPADIGRRKPVSDEGFEIVRAQFSAHPRQPESVAVEQVDGTDTWRLERHDLRYADGATFTTYVLKPLRERERYQAVVYGPHGGATVPHAERDLRAVLNHALSVVRTGRWVFMPEWAGMFSRISPSLPPGDASAVLERQRRAAHAWYQDSSDTLEYIGTFAEIDQEHIGFLSESFGSVAYGPMLLALQPQYRTAVFVSAGLIMSKLHPMMDMINYLPRVNQPVLMANGLFDPTFPHETSQIPFYEALGTPVERKRIVLYRGGHLRYPPNLLAAEIASWYDGYLGPP